MNTSNPSSPRLPSARAFALGAVALSIGSATVLVGLASRPADAKPRKKPTTTAKAPAGREVATLAAGCFWSMEAIYQQFKGVERVEPGYAGGHLARPTYARVSQGRTGHAEALQITFDPKVISYADLVNVMLTVRDPTTLNKQGADEGPNYRSVIFFHSPAQQKAARGEIRRVTQARVWKQPIVTRVERFSNFYKAEDYHFNYYNRNIDAPYCKAVIAPKLAELRAKFASKLKS